MGIIPLERLIEYKGNRYELSRAMIELAKSGGRLLRAETKYRGGKYIPTVMRNILDGKIRYDYEEGASMGVDEEAPFKHSGSEYEENIYIAKIEIKDVEEFTEEEEEQIEEEEDLIIEDGIIEDEEDIEGEDDSDDEEKASKRKKRTVQNKEE